MRTKIIRIHWSESRLIDDVISELPRDKVGLYYITRMYNGKESSLYLGESISSIQSRLKDHKSWVHNYSHSKIYVRVGSVVYPKQNVENAIKHAEKALIYEHGQCGTKVLFENTVSTKSYNYTDVYRIINEGDRFELKYEVDMNDHEDV